MTGRIFTADHHVYELPPLLAWNVTHTGTVPCDSWQVTAVYTAEMAAALKMAAGFAAIDQGKLTDAGKGFSIVLMLIGGSSGSTAGGLKTVTFVVLVLFMAARARGRSRVCVFKRTIPEHQIQDAMTIALILIGLSVFGGIFISATSPVGFADGLYEAVSALATVGVTAGATGKLSLASQLLMILYMYFGRVGVLTISLGFLMGDTAQERFRYAQTNLLIG